MGQCIGRGSDDPFNDIHPHIFSVLNIDENGSRRVEGRIEVTETDLILNQRGHDRIRWPLRSLRRYGFESGVFSFEAGRRCPTGPGIYAFRCSRAENLFNLLQSRVRNPYIDDHSPFGDQRPDPIPREPAPPSINRGDLGDMEHPMPSLAEGSYINIPHTNNPGINDLMPNDMGLPAVGQIQTNEINPITNDNDIQQPNNNQIASQPPSRTNSNTMRNPNQFVNPMESPLSSPPPIIGNQAPQTPTDNSPPPLSGGIDSVNNNMPNGFLPTMVATDNDGVNEKPKPTSDFRANKPPALDLFSNHHIPLRPNPDPPTYENVDISNCPPPLHPKTPISPPNNISPTHTEINHTFRFSEALGFSSKEQSPTEPQLATDVERAQEGLSYAVLDLKPSSSNVNHSPSSPLHSEKTPKSSNHFVYNSEMSPAKQLSKSADSLVLGNNSLLLQNTLPVQEEVVGCEYTHIDIRRTEAFRKSKEQNENNMHFAYDGANGLATNPIPEDRVISTNDIKEGNNNPLAKAFTKALPTITIDKLNFDFNLKRNSVISQ